MDIFWNYTISIYAPNIIYLPKAVDTQHASHKFTLSLHKLVGQMIFFCGKKPNNSYYLSNYRKRLQIVHTQETKAW